MLNWVKLIDALRKISGSLAPLLLIDEIVENGRELNLEMHAEDVVQLINSPDPKLTIEKFIKLKKLVEKVEKYFEPTLLKIS